MAENDPLESMLEKAANETDGERVSVGDLLDLYEDRTFGPVFTFLGLLVVLPPLGAIPGLPVVIGMLLVLFAFQMMVGSSHLWVPDFVESLSISKPKVRAARQKSSGVLARFDSLLTERLAWAVSKPARVIAAGIVMVLGLTLIPLELVPFAVALPGLAITLIGLAIMARDGLLMLAALALSVVAFGVLAGGMLP